MRTLHACVCDIIIMCCVSLERYSSYDGDDDDTEYNVFFLNDKRFSCTLRFIYRYRVSNDRVDSEYFHLI